MLIFITTVFPMLISGKPQSGTCVRPVRIIKKNYLTEQRER